ncbi:MAG: VOC family protein [bacterium]|nr:VOC family protein [bacterium]
MGYQHGLFSWADVSAPDPAAASAFYAALFGWHAEDQQMPDGSYMYTMFSMDGEATAGLGQQPAEMSAQGIPPMWNSYVTVDSVDETIEKWTAAGGTVMMPAMDVMTSGRMAFVVDPEEAFVGLWEAGDHVGAGVFHKPGAMNWNELSTRNSEAARDFYGKALGWTFEEFPGSSPAYWLITMPDKKQGDPLSEDVYNGGFLTLDETFPDTIPAHWGVYFGVVDTDAVAAKATELGGSVVVPAMDTPAGRICVVSDPQGGTFSIIAPPAEQA